MITSNSHVRPLAEMSPPRRMESTYLGELFVRLRELRNLFWRVHDGNVLYRCYGNERKCARSSRASIVMQGTPTQTNNRVTNGV